MSWSLSKHPEPPAEGYWPHECQHPGCGLRVVYDDEPYCFKHSPDEGSSVPGFSAKAKGLVDPLITREKEAQHGA